jgi:hypothetical protein
MEFTMMVKNGCMQTMELHVMTNEHANDADGILQQKDMMLAWDTLMEQKAHVVGMVFKSHTLCIKQISDL